MKLFIIAFWWTVAGTAILVFNGAAFMNETGPMWRKPRPEGTPGIPEWDTDANAWARFWFTWAATISDAAIVVLLIAVLLGKL